MKKINLLLLLAFFAGVTQSFAINWDSDSYGWVSNGSNNAAYTNAYKMDVPAGCNLVNIQSSFGTEIGFYVLVPAADISCSLPSGKYATQGASILLYVSAFTAQETKVTVTCNSGQEYVFTIYYKDGTAGGGGEGPVTPDPPTPSSACSDISTESQNVAGNMSFKNNGYRYAFSTSGTSVTISFTLLDDYERVAAYLWKYYSQDGFNEQNMTYNSTTKEATITLPDQTPNSQLTIACKFAYSGASSVTKKFIYTVGDNCETPDCGTCFGVTF